MAATQGRFAEVAREALVADTGRAKLAGLVREALIVGTGLFGTITARSTGQGTANATVAGVNLTGRITATSRIADGPTFPNLMVGSITSRSAMNTAYTAPLYLAGTVEGSSELFLGLAVRLFGVIDTSSSARSRPLAQTLFLSGARLTTRSRASIFSLATTLNVSATLTARSRSRLTDPYHVDVLSLGGRITAASFVRFSAGPSYESLVVLNLN